MQSKSGFSGVYPMVFALFDDKGGLAREPMRRQIKALLAAKVHGIAILGMATEVNKLSTAERRTLMEWVAEDIGGAVPLAVTVAESSIQGQIDFVRGAAAVGAKWAILQPPPVKAVPESALIRFFGAVADKVPIPVGIQNAPEYLGIGLSHGGISELHRAHPNVAIVKLEATALAISRLIEQVDGTLDVFNGRDGIEMLDSIRAGAVGIIPGAEVADILARVFDLHDGGKADEAERLYESILPLLIVLMETMDTFLVYGKHVLAHRFGIHATETRIPFTPPTAFGLEMMRRYSAAAGPV
ncbi:MAG TPA: dihydrodipicolinate synthase family protein [Dongiaceae bacterium]|jgi:4-hydroxy-tetrahydrodipicolinate synthase|nr:dihydrodipicolinate synthase family protein [Dongiaceae bacterium]